MVILAMALLIAVASFPVNGQEVSLIVDDRVEAAVVVPVQDGPAPTVRRGGWDLSAIIAAAYDSNIYLSPENPTSDVVVKLGPSIAYAKGDETEGEGGHLAVVYQPTAVVYLESNGDNRLDHEAAWTAGWKGKASSVIYKGVARKLGDATADTGRQTDRVEFDNVIRVAWIPREKVALELAAGDGKLSYDDPDLFDSRKTFGEVAIRYAYSPKTRVGLAYQIGRFKVDGSDRQDTQQIAADIQWQPREKIAVNLLAGAEHRKYENGSDTTPVIEGRVDWKPAEGTAVYLTGYQREVASAYLAGQNYRLRGFTAGLSRRIGGKWTANLEGGRESASYKQVSGPGSGGREDKIWFVRPSFRYHYTEALDFEVFYRIADNRSNRSGFGYDQEMAGFLLEYKF